MKKALFRRMEAMGFYYNSRSWKDYERAKSKLIRDFELTPTEYKRTVRAIAEFFGL